MADWTLSKLGRGNKFASDIGNYPSLAGYGYQNPLQNVAYLFDLSPTLTPAIVLQWEQQGVQYILADNRLSQSLPVSGSYFPGQTTNDIRSCRLIDLTKFNSPGIPRVFDDGRHRHLRRARSCIMNRKNLDLVIAVVIAGLGARRRRSTRPRR